MPTLPYALTPLVFPFRHLAAHAGRAGLGGGREVALGCFLVARLAADRLASDDDGDGDGRAARAAGAKSWLGAITIPAAVRGHLAKCLEMSTAAPAPALAEELRALTTAAAPWLDAGSRSELDALATELAR